MINVVLVLIIAVIVGAAVLYIRKQKKSGSACIGCPHAKSCSGGCNSREKQ